MPVINPDNGLVLPDSNGSVSTNAIRLLYLPDYFLQMDAQDDIECGSINLLALGLTVQEFVLIDFLLTLPFRTKYWPFRDNLDRQACANLYVKISGD